VIINQGKVVAQGTAKELKATIGGGVLQVHVASKEQLPALTNVLQDFKPHPDAGFGMVTIPVKDGTKMLPEVIRRIDAAGIEISDIELRKPTLDEVFISLTSNKK